MTAKTYHGMMVLEKPTGITSRAAVDKVESWFPRGIKIGHTGTLDPLATGVLVLCLGDATRLTEYVQDMRKTYRTTVLLDARSDTDDADGQIERLEFVEPPPDRGQIEECLRNFVGTIEQVPPAYSAARIGGQRAYDRARRGQEVTLAPRTVQVYGIDVLSYDYPQLQLDVRCGKGTYIRSLARDLGERLRRAALVEILRRTCVGPFRVEDAVALDEEPTRARERLLPLEMALSELPQMVLTPQEAAALRNGGQALSRKPSDLPANVSEVSGLDSAGRLVAVLRWDAVFGRLRPSRVFAER
jgi:tRNA pseudouridine55 synthase